MKSGGIMLTNRVTIKLSSKLYFPIVSQKIGNERNEKGRIENFWEIEYPISHGRFDAVNPNIRLTTTVSPFWIV